MNEKQKVLDALWEIIDNDIPRDNRDFEFGKLNEDSKSVEYSYKMKGKLKRINRTIEIKIY